MINRCVCESPTQRHLWDVTWVMALCGVGGDGARREWKRQVSYSRWSWEHLYVPGSSGTHVIYMLCLFYYAHSRAYIWHIDTAWQSCA